MIIAKEKLSDQSLFVNVRNASLLLRAINNKYRQTILLLLEQHIQLTVTEIMVHLRQEQSLISQHLAIMRRAGIVKTNREGKNIYYGLNYLRLEEIDHLTALLLKL